jgi:poly(3-hydroxybutyrate) depolymerase
MEQWTELAGADQKPDFGESLGPRNSVRHERYLDRSGRAVVETYRIANMTHGIAIDGSPDAHCGEPSAFVLDVGVCAVRLIARFWGL